MKRLLAVLASVCFATQAALAQDSGKTFSDMINDFMTPISKAISSVVFYAVDMSWLYDGAPALPLIVVWLLGGGIFFTFYMGFPNIRGFKQSMRIVKGTYDDPEDPGEVTHFQALSAAVSGTVGLGNIAGVALAISVGGAGATFWMIIAGLFGMTSKFVECTLGVKYREIDENGVVSGGPMHYLSKGLANMGLAGLGKVLAVAAAMICIGGAFGAGAIFQVNQSAMQFTNEVSALTGGTESFFYGKGWIFGIIFASVVGLVIIGGIKKITHVTEFLVPIMAIVYVSASMIIIFSNISMLPDALSQIFIGAFTAEGVQGGILGVLIQGLRRASFSNEAGLGSASIAHAAAKTKEPVAEGLVALLEPFIDTVVICTITALVIIITGSVDASASGNAAGIALTSKAFASVIDWFPYVLTVAVIMFAFSTSITWFYYGQRSFLWLVGDKPMADLLFKIAYLSALIVGSAMSLGAVVDIADALLLAMGVPNILGLFLLRKEVKGMLTDYFARVKSGEIRPYEG
ncbi:alanine:cation symporter family protein [Kordiimonas sp. SCSIO 12603]|uniref:alanine/glycine:cation symporter family protein n=1 Tax=Kordiimonas sp. SCSIO 12603 TaxID=2829596 RepID=UPI002107F033|nr:alanine/glycine:cation symporter family protein [Kordiimonas sp. SCSIO 12603]UTW57656.1 alanine:cation symporter family protein [Kordiimonas sp. SCSIO 12603]